ncbi:class C sortase [Actinomyces bouchesdurhonensis]|uniref:class C sortase n=1 Tax=Actinomyces bouchesdurhonensis TaxID=1852361 RepID=UPI0028E3D5FA|nr:class C sortase [Actinomyces bouchesdurhonensis]
MSTQTPNHKKTPLKRRLLTIAPPILLLAGILVLLYPVLATQYNNYRQETIASQFSAVAQDAGPDAVAENLRRADEYNATAAESPILDPWLDAQRPDTAPYQEYLSQLNLNDVMATIKIPAINVNLPIYHGTESATLDKGIGHLFGTALPVGGDSTHTVLTGHTGLGTATMFDQLTSLKEGDIFYIEVPGRHLKYQVTDIRVVLPNETETLNKVEGKDLATLITCTPYGINTHRLLVTGERVPMDEATAAAEAAQVKGAVLKPWMIAILIAVAIILLVSAIIWARSRKRREDPQAVEGAAAAGALAPADSGDETGAQSAAEPGVSAGAGATPAGTSPEAPDSPGAPDAVAADPGAAPTPDLLADAEKISDEEIDAGRSAALKKILEERGKQ